MRSMLNFLLAVAACAVAYVALRALGLAAILLLFALTQAL